MPTSPKRVILLEAKQKGDLLEFLRELIEYARAGEWASFREESAICHLFLTSVKCEDSKKICLKLLRKNPEGDTKKLIAELQTLKNLQNVDTMRGGKAKPVV